jgi:formamidopyrimidine-DNA glycosylase
VDRAEFAALIRRRRGAIKPVLMNQTTLAGLGNLLVDEMLWRARIHPQRASASLDDAELAALHRAMRRILRDSMRPERVPPRPSWLTGARDTAERRCPRCHTALSRLRSGGRTTYLCPRCQPRRD